MAEDKKTPEKKDPMMQIDKVVGVAGKVMQILRDNSEMIKNNPKMALFVAVSVAVVIGVITFIG